MTSDDAPKALVGEGSQARRTLALQRLRSCFNIQDSHNRTLAKNLGLILTWYVLSTGLSLFNKKLVGKNHGLFGNGAFPAPLFMSSIQFACQTLLARFVFGAGLLERSRKQPLPWKEYAKIVLPNGIITGLDIGFSNKSLVYITMSFYTMCKSTVPVFLLLFAFIWRIERPSMELAGVVGVIVTGLTLLVKGETEFDLVGFSLVMSASCFSGLRFTLTQVLLHGHGHSNTAAMGGPLEVLEVLTPVMSITVLVLSVAWEKLWVVLPPSPYFMDFKHLLGTFGVIFVGATIAFLMVWTEYQVIKETSALTFMIAGTCKEVVTVIAAVIIMGDKLTPVNIVGLAIVIFGVLLFNYYKYRKIRTGEIPVYTALKDGKDDHEEGEMNVLLPRSAGGGGGSSGNGSSFSNGLSSSASVGVNGGGSGDGGDSVTATTTGASPAVTMVAVHRSGGGGGGGGGGSTIGLRDGADMSPKVGHKAPSKRNQEHEPLLPLPAGVMTHR